VALENPSERWVEGPAALASIWRYRWLVLGTTLLFGLLGFFASFQQPTVYETSAQLYLSDPASSDVFGQRDSADLERYVPQQADRLASTPVLTAAAESLEGMEASTLEAQLAVDGDPELGTLTIVVRSGDAQVAADAANAIAGAYEDNVRAFQLTRAERAAEELQAAEADIQAQIDALTTDMEDVGDTAAQGQLAVLAQRLVEIDTLAQQLRVDARLFGSGVEFVEAAQPPGAPVAPTPRRTAAVVALLGAVLASAVAYWLAGRSRRVVGRDDPAVALGVPLLGVLPTYEVNEVASLRERTALEPRTAEAYRFVQSSLLRLLRESGARSVLITSASPSTGKTETALQLAVTANERGSRVLLIDADVRMRGLTRFLRAERGPGLLDLGRSPAPPAGELVTDYRVSDDHDLAVLTAGSVRGDDLAHVQESWFGRAVPDLIDRFDLTILDSSPLLAVADTATIAAYSDAVVLVVREGSSLDDLVRVRQRMRFVGQRLVGYVYLTPDALDDTAFDYGLVRSGSRSVPSGNRGLATSEPRSRLARGLGPTSAPAATTSATGTARSRYPAAPAMFTSTDAGSDGDPDGDGADPAGDPPFGQNVASFGLDDPRAGAPDDEARRDDTT
jgi:Mrp family chromosome partitioning ATPase